MVPLTVARSRPRAFTPFAVTLPLTLDADRSPSLVTPPSETSPDTLFASSTFGVADVRTSPLTFSTRTMPCTFDILITPETDLASTPAEAGRDIV